METRVAKTFIKVAELGNITKAAEQLGYTQGAVTLQIRQLEDDLGVTLFDRVGRGIRITDAGMRFREYAERLVRASEDADSFAIDESDPTGDLMIEASSSVSIGILPKLLHAFHDMYPRINVKVRVTEDTDILIDHLRQGRIDLAMMMEPRQDFEGCTLAAERTEEFRFVARSDDRLAGIRNVSLNDVLDSSYVTSFISTDRDMDRYYVVESYLKQQGVETAPAVEFGALASVISYLKSGGGHAFLPLYMIEDELANGELVVLDTESPQVYEHTQLFYSSTRWLSPQMKTFIDFIRKSFMENS